MNSNVALISSAASRDANVADDGRVVVRARLGTQMSDERFTRIETKIDDLRNELRAEFRSEIGGLRNQMLVLHEDLVGRIAALAPDYALIDRRIAKSRSELRDELIARIEPLEIAERVRHRRRR